MIAPGGNDGKSAPGEDPQDATERLPDDPRLMQAVNEYLAELERGGAPRRGDFLTRYSDLAGPLSRCLDGLELVHAAAPPVAPVTTPTERPAAIEGLPANPLGDFRVIRELGRGGMGIVYEAVQISLERRVALKVLPFAAAFDGRHLQRFRNEAQAAAQLHHTNIVPVHAVGCERGVHFYAMQLIDGQPLTVWVEGRRRERQARITGTKPSTSANPERDRASLRFAVRCIVQAAEGLEHAHEAGIVHRDIKPANLLVDVRERVWITDFGLAQFHDDAGLTQTGDLVGTLRYMSPEQAAGKRALVDPRADVYSLGATLYELVTLEPMLPGRNRQELLHQIMHQTPRAPRSVERSVPVDLETIILKAIGKAPGERYPSARAFAEDLQRHLDGKTIHARRPTVVERAMKWARRHPSVVVATVAVLALATAGLWVSNRMIAEEQAKTARRAEEAERRFTQAREAVDVLVTVCEEELGENPIFQGTRQRLLETALDYYKSFLEEQRGNAEQTAALNAGEARVRAILDHLSAFHGARLSYLVRDPNVQEDLRVAADQVAQLGQLEAARTNESSLAGILQSDQMARLRQIALQVQGVAAFHETVVLDRLELSGDQRERIHKIERDATASPWFGPPGGGPMFGGMRRPDAADMGRFRAAMNDPATRDEIERAFSGDERAASRLFAQFQQRRGLSNEADSRPADPEIGRDIERAWAGDGSALRRMMDRAKTASMASSAAAIARVIDVLTPQQRERWAALVGEPFRGLSDAARPSPMPWPPFHRGRR